MQPRSCLHPERDLFTPPSPDPASAPPPDSTTTPSGFLRPPKGCLQQLPGVPSTEGFNLAIYSSLSQTISCYRKIGFLPLARESQSPKLVVRVGPAKELPGPEGGAGASTQQILLPTPLPGSSCPQLWGEEGGGWEHSTQVPERRPDLFSTNCCARTPSPAWLRELKGKFKGVELVKGRVASKPSPVQGNGAGG